MDDLGVRPILRNPYGDFVEGVHQLQHDWINLKVNAICLDFVRLPTRTRMMSVHDAEWSKRCAAYHNHTYMLYIIYYIYMCIIYILYILDKKGVV